MSFFEIILVLFFIGISAFMSLAEISLIGISKIRLHHMVERGVPGAKLVHNLVAQLDQVITTILVWSNFLNAALTSLITAACVVWLGEHLGVFVASMLSGSIVLLFTDIVPKIYAARSTERVSLAVGPGMRALLRVSKPVSRWMTNLTNAVLKLMRVPVTARSPLVTEEELKLMIELGKREGVLGEHERKLLHRIFEFGDLKVEAVMIPRERIVKVSSSATHDQILSILTEEGHSRIPVYQHDAPDRIIGILYAQELLHVWREGTLIVLQDLLHPPFEVPPDKRVIDLLEDFQKHRAQIAIVVDREKRVLGLVTLEDLTEEIVGEIGEQYDANRSA
ncbi:MAG: hemolysin family protein [Candidatus Omnitrophica bacterium]|nr:hemolysin family protein [Candidatus Omnitrophota bacterium]